jgi:hypothetical protein
LTLFQGLPAGISIAQVLLTIGHAFANGVWNQRALNLQALENGGPALVGFEKLAKPAFKICHIAVAKEEVDFKCLRPVESLV